MSLPSEQEVRLRELVNVFLEENGKLNLSAFRTEEQCWIGNILDSIAFLELSQLQTANCKLLDIGTGGGFPLLPLAIALPDAKLTGVDSVQKKIDAVQRIADAMELSNVDLLCQRTEELGREEAHREQYDIVTLRAIAPINVGLEYAAPLTKVSGFIVMWKSMKIDTEMEESLLARADLSCHLIDQYTYELPGDFGKRQLLLFEKTFATSDKYPRKVGEPKKNPLV